MAFLDAGEIIQLFIITLALGYIFSGFIKRNNNDLFSFKNFSWKNIFFAALIATPAVVLHEFGHKFAALLLGLDAHFEVFGLGLVLGLVLRVLGSGFLLLAPGYVVISGLQSSFAVFFTAFAGPFVNLVFWLCSLWLLRSKFSLSEGQIRYFSALALVNKWLFIFNMIPLPPLDGSKVLFSLWSLLF